MTIKVYNTLTRQKETFTPKYAGKVGMYVCGPTTYNYIHLGNARPLIVFDTVRRYFEYRGYEVNYVQNFTDIDDKIIKRASEEKMDALKLSAKYIDEYFRDAGALGVREANVHPKVSEHISEIIEMIRVLVEKGHAYEVDGDVYYAVKSFQSYGKLSGRSLDDMQAGARVEVDDRKQDPMDFALWKSAKPGEPSWESPWGLGRPGWHIECSVMALKYLGDGFDIHGGGFDLIFPHHENEIAQSEAYLEGKAFAKYWMHNGFITINQEKMSKSLGNFFTVREILAKFDPEIVRFFMLSTHYRSPLDFHDGKLEESHKALERLKNTLDSVNEHLKQGANSPMISSQEAKPSAKNSKAQGKGAKEQDNNSKAQGKGAKSLAKTSEAQTSASILSVVCRAAEDKFQEAMDDDFNTALAIATLFDLSREINAHLSNLRGKPFSPEEGTSLKQAADLLRTLGQVLGLLEPKQLDQKQESSLADGLMELIITIRQEARQKKDWATADKIRDELNALGIVLEDSPQGVRWKRRT